MRRLLIVLLLAVWTKATYAQDVKELTAKSDPAFQTQVQKIVDALHQPRVDPEDNLDAIREVQTYKKLADDKDKLVEQLAIYVAATEDEDFTHEVIALVVLDFLRLKPSVPVRVLAPLLESENRQLRNFAQSWFSAHDGTALASPEGPPFKPVNYDDYEEYVSWKLGRGEEVPAGFVRYIYERSPGRALLVFAYAGQHGDVSARLQAIGTAIEARQQGKLPEESIGRDQQLEVRRQARVRGRREIELAEHIVSNAVWLKENGFADRFQAALPDANETLATLANHKEWWARLYVAYIMRKYPELRRADIIQQLAEDENELVHDAAKPAEK
jgi:hypothetical protein